jgi:hypothetical protein
MKDTLVKTSIEGSLIIQIVTLLINVFAFLVPVDQWDFALKEILALETLVQVVELVFYEWYRGQLVNGIYDVTKFRYYDWFFTTPTMLFTTAAYYGYLHSKDETEEKKEPFSVKTFFQEESQWIYWIFVFNAAMLFFGYLQEVGSISVLWSSLLGYMSLLGSFGVLYYKFVSKTQQQRWLFWFMFSVWSLYGVAAVFPAPEKNISYNILDIFAKNFYGLFLSGILFTSNTQTKDVSL